MNKTLKPIEILLVEDSPVDVLIAREALVEAKLLSEIHVAEDGVAAMDFLHKRGKFLDPPSPGLILLDLNLPRKNGRECLPRSRQMTGSSTTLLWSSPSPVRRRIF